MFVEAVLASAAGEITDSSFPWKVGTSIVETLILGLVVMCLILGGFGILLGIMYAKLMIRLPWRSDYLKALVVAGIISAIVSVPRILKADYTPDLLGTNVIISVLFAYLFHRWTK